MLVDFSLQVTPEKVVAEASTNNVNELKAAIRQAVEEIPQEMTRRVMENFRNRLQQCIASRGRRLEDHTYIHLHT